MIRAEKLTKYFGDIQVFSNIDLHIPPGTSTAIVGASGEGKSTLLHILAGLEPASSGSVWMDDVLVKPSNAASMRLQTAGFLFQNFHLLEQLSAAENVVLPARIAGRRQAAEPLLALVGLEHKATTPAKLLSGGEKQRVALARALCNDPKILFADEPTGNLDPHSAAEIHRLLIDLRRHFGKTLVVVTHNQELAQQMDRQLSLQGGQLHEPFSLSS